MKKRINKAMLVYQAGIANVFSVDCFNLAAYGRNAKRLIQSDFRTCENYAYGMVTAGCTVKAAGCNMAGNITDMLWTQDFDSLPFSDSFRFPENWEI